MKVIIFIWKCRILEYNLILGPHNMEMSMCFHKLAKSSFEARSVESTRERVSVRLEVVSNG